jgi:hypothetical protein
MKTPDLSKTPIVKNFGARGARWYGRIWFAWLYTMLVSSAAGLWIYYPDSTFTGTWRRVVFGSLIAALLVVAASVLTQMRIKFFAGFKHLEASEKLISH